MVKAWRAKILRMILRCATQVYYGCTILNIVLLSSSVVIN